MKASEFVKKCESALSVKTCYALGCFGQVLTDSFIAQKEAQYKDWYTRNKSKLIKGAFGFDCICFVKAILWGWTPDKQAVYCSNGVPDVTESTMLESYCTDISNDMSKIATGEYIYKSGHCGIYVGNGKVIECTTAGTFNVQRTNLSDKAWEKHGKLKFIDYNENSNIIDMCNQIIQIANNIKEDLNK